MNEQDLSYHDSTVLRIAIRELAKGSEMITIGDRVKDRLYIAYRLKLKYPFRKILTYDEDGEIEVI